MSAAPFAFGLILTGCVASPELGYDPWSGTFASEIRLYRSEIAYKITCENGTRFCLKRAEAICGGRYLIAGWPSKSPRAQVLLNMRIETVNTDNPSIIRIVCE
ncbi:MAG: hypothetical protein WBS19_11775 [Candidatus Korobacteraceae bacterium]